MNDKEFLFNDKIVASVIFILIILQMGIGGFFDDLIRVLIGILFIWYFYLLWRNKKRS